MMRAPEIRPGIALERAAWACTVLVLAGCAAAPPLNLYTLSDGSLPHEGSVAAADPPPPRGAPVIEIARVSLPEYLDSRDLILRRGDLLERSNSGRWASRLSVAATDLLTTQLAMHLPAAWVTDEPPAQPPDYRLLVHVDRLDITSSGAGIVDADWQLVPRNASGEIRRRTHFEMTGTVGTDEAIVHFERALLDRLASEIDDTQWPGQSKAVR